MDEKQKRSEAERQVVEDAIRLTMRLRTMQEGRMNHLLKCEFVSCGVDPYSICLRYPVQEWELNPAGHLHGGASATMMDVTMGMLAHALSNGYACVTTGLSIQYLRPVNKGDWIRAEATAEFVGMHMLNFMAKGILEKNGKTAFIAHSGYMITETRLADVVYEQYGQK